VFRRPLKEGEKAFKVGGKNKKKEKKDQTFYFEVGKDERGGKVQKGYKNLGHASMERSGKGWEPRN